MINIKKFIEKLHGFNARLYFASNEEAVQKIMACEPKECLKLGIPMSNILQIYKQSVVHLTQNNRSSETCRSIVRGLQGVKASRIELDFV